eukprot:366229-Chlamydomonas_euryale.AAC.54
MQRSAEDGIIHAGGGMQSSAKEGACKAQPRKERSKEVKRSQRNDSLQQNRRCLALLNLNQLDSGASLVSTLARQSTSPTMLECPYHS